MSFAVFPVGLALHGEPGVERIGLLGADATAERVYATEVGEFCTSQEMKGLSVTFLR